MKNGKERKEIQEKIDSLRVAKQLAVDTRDYELASKLRDIERELHEQMEALNGHEWMDKECHKSQLLSTSIMSMRPDIGFFIRVDSLDISENIFPAEFKKITEAYHSVVGKMNDHYLRKKTRDKSLKNINNLLDKKDERDNG